MSLHCAAETYIKIKVPGADGAEGKAMNFMYFLAILIGPLVKILYSFIGNYAVTMVVATLLLKLLLFPLSIHQQKSSAKMAVFQPLMNEIQQKYNEEHGITPQTIKKAVRDLIAISKAASAGDEEFRKDPESMDARELEKLAKELTKKMRQAAAELNFEEAAKLRDRMKEVKQMLLELEKN